MKTVPLIRCILLGLIFVVFGLNGLWQTKAQRRQGMSNSISTLLTRNLHDVFGENDPGRRRAAIDEIFTEDCVFYEVGSRRWGMPQAIPSSIWPRMM